MNIQQIKDKYTCLDYLGDRVVRKTANAYLARCPWREDRHPSLGVSQNGKGWIDYATGEKGNLIDLVMRSLETKDLSRVCAEFESKSFSFIPAKILDSIKEEGTGFRSFSVVPLQSRGLYAYLHQRGISINIARQFLQEAHYSFEKSDGRYLYALAYGNDLGGYELRSVRFKGSTAPKGITTHFGGRNADTGQLFKSCVVFEGFFDMLSFATLSGEVRHDYVVLNSIVNAQDGIDALRDYSGRILLALDNDEAGTKATAQILEQLPSAIDIRGRFSPAKDINDYLTTKSN